MSRSIKTRLTVSTMLAVLGVVSATGLSGQESAVGGEVPAPIGFVEIDGVGRFDIHPVPEVMTRNDAFNFITKGSKPVAYWNGGHTEGMGGGITIFALPATGDPTRSSVLVQFFLSDDPHDRVALGVEILGSLKDLDSDRVASQPALAPRERFANDEPQESLGA